MDKDQHQQRTIVRKKDRALLAAIGVFAMAMAMMPETNRLDMNMLMMFPTTRMTSIHHQNSERRLLPLKSKIRLEANFIASTKPSDGNALIFLIR